MSTEMADDEPQPHSSSSNNSACACASAPPAAAAPVLLPRTRLIPLDEATVEVDPRIKGLDLSRRTLGDREIQAFFGPKGLPDFLGLGPSAALPTYQELMRRQREQEQQAAAARAGGRW